MQIKGAGGITKLVPKCPCKRCFGRSSNTFPLVHGGYLPTAGVQMQAQGKPHAGHSFRAIVAKHEETVTYIHLYVYIFVCTSSAR